LSFYWLKINPQNMKSSSSGVSLKISSVEPERIHYNLGNSCLEMQKYSQAFEHFQKSIGNLFQKN
jgi:predicted component of type VI protein secretion system